MKTRYIIVSLLVTSFVISPIVAQTNTKVSEIFSYLGEHSGSFSMSFILATSKQSEKIAIAQYESPVYVYDAKNNAHEYYSERSEGSYWTDTKFVTFLDNDTKFLSAFTNYNDIPDSSFLYDAKTQKLLSRMSKDANYIGCSEDGNLLFTQPKSYDKFYIRNTITQDVISTIAMEGNIQKICYPEQSSLWCMLFLLNQQYYIAVFDKSTNKELYRVSPTNKYIRTFRMSPNGEYILITGASDIDQQASQATLYSLRTNKIIRRHTGELFNKVSEGEFSPDGKSYVIAINHLIYKYDIESDKNPVTIPLYHLEGGAIMGMRWISGTEKLAVQGATGEGFYSTIIDLQNPAYQKLFGLPDFYYMHLLSGGDRVLFFGKEVILFDRRTSEIQWNFSGYIRQRCFEVREDLDKMLFIGNRSNTMYIMDLNTQAIYHKINIGRSDICCLRFSRSGEKVMYIPDKRDTVFIYDLQTSETKKINISNLNKGLDVFFDDIDTKRIFIHGESMSFLFDENCDRISNFYARVCRDKYEPDYTIYESYKGKWVFTDKPVVFSHFMSPKLGLYNFEVDTVIYDQTKESSLLSSDINNKSTIIHYHSLIDNDTKLLTVHSDTVLRHWDMNNYSLLFESRLSFARRRYLGSSTYYVAAHKDGVSTVATLTDKRRVVFMEIPDAPLSVEEKNSIPTMEIESYPQPIHINDGHFFMSVPMAEIETIAAISVLGEIVPLQFVQTDASTYRIMLSSLSRGHYTVQIKTQSGQALVHSILVL